MKTLFIAILSVVTLSCVPENVRDFSNLLPQQGSATLQVNKSVGGQLVLYVEGRRVATLIRETECVDISEYSTRQVAFGFKFLAEPVVYAPVISVGEHPHWVIDITSYNHRSLIYDMNTIRPADEPCDDR